jgi:hypothetical protein
MPKIYDANRLRKTYPLLRVKPRLQDFTVIEGLDAETVILDYVGTHTQTYFFTKNYTSIPTISATPEDENVNLYITSLTTDKVTIESSSSFTGSVHVQILKDTSQNV